MDDDTILSLETLYDLHFTDPRRRDEFVRLILEAVSQRLEYEERMSVMAMGEDSYEEGAALRSMVCTLSEQVSSLSSELESAIGSMNILLAQQKALQAQVLPLHPATTATGLHSGIISLPPIPLPPLQ